MRSTSTFPAVLHRTEQGQALVEFALVLMFVILPITYVLIETALTLFALSNVTNAVREGARAGALYQYPACDTTDIACPLNPTAYNFNQLASAIDDARKTSIKNAVFTWLRSVPLVDPQQCTDDSHLTITYPDSLAVGNPYRAGTPLTVDMSCPHFLLFGLANASQVNLSSSATMRIEPGGVRNP